MDERKSKEKISDEQFKSTFSSTFAWLGEPKDSGFEYIELTAERFLRISAVRDILHSNRRALAGTTLLDNPRKARRKVFRMVRRRRSNHRWWKTEGILDGFDHVVIGPIPEGTFAKGDHFPTEHTETPHIRRGGEFPVINRFDGRPANGDLPTFGRVTVTFVDLSTKTKVGHFAD